MNKKHSSQLSICLALAACSFGLPAGAAANNLIELQLTPAGFFRPSDGRKLKVPGWNINAALAAKVIERFNARKNDAVIDYEHQTLHKETNGQPAPAAGWIKEIFWREGKGLFARAEMTARALAAIASGEYKLFSPVFSYDALTGDVRDLQMGALTNFPALDGLEPLTARAAATFGINPLEDSDVNPLLLAILTALGLPDTTTEADAIAALATSGTDMKKLREELDLKEGSGVAEITAACTSLKTRAAAQKPDPAKFVGVEVVESLKTELAALTKKVNGDQVDGLVKSALATGKLLPAQEKWARDLGAFNIAALTGYLGTAQPMAALSGTQTHGNEPSRKEGEHGLTPAELAVCTATGVTPEAFAKARA